MDILLCLGIKQPINSYRSHFLHAELDLSLTIKTSACIISDMSNCRNYALRIKKSAVHAEEAHKQRHQAQPSTSTLTAGKNSKFYMRNVS